MMMMKFMIGLSKRKKQFFFGLKAIKRKQKNMIEQFNLKLDILRDSIE